MDFDNIVLNTPTSSVINTQYIYFFTSLTDIINSFPYLYLFSHLSLFNKYVQE